MIQVIGHLLYADGSRLPSFQEIPYKPLLSPLNKINHFG